jgi:hypothetical protein
MLSSCTPAAGSRAPATTDYADVYSHPHKLVGAVKPWEILEFERPQFCVAAQTTSSGVVQLSPETYEDVTYVTLFAWHFTQGSAKVFPVSELWLDDGRKYKSATITENQTFFAYPIDQRSDLLKHLDSLASDQGLLVSLDGGSMRFSFGSPRELIAGMEYACSRKPEYYMVAKLSD